MKKLIFSLLALVVVVAHFASDSTTVHANEENEVDVVAMSCSPDTRHEVIPVPLAVAKLSEEAINDSNVSENNVEEEITIEEPTVLEEENSVEDEVPEDQIELLAILTMAEAEGECEKGQRLVIDVVLNRVDARDFPNDIYSVIWEKGQFSSMWDGRADRCSVTEKMVNLVKEELKNRTNYDVLFYRTQHYHSFGVPLFQVGAHYFSGC